MKRKICLITGTRAEYGLLKPLIDEIRNDSNLILQFIVIGMHLSPEFGLTYEQIEEDGIKIDKKIEMLLSSDTPVGITKSMGLAQIGFADAYAELNPDLIVVLGDRFEILSAASAALIAQIPIAHLHGGESTEGAFDDSIRHSITKMSHLHFTSTEEYKRRVIQLGEEPSRVFNVGAIGLDNIRKLRLLSKRELEAQIGICFDRHNILVTFHPVTLDDNTSRDQFSELLSALDELNETLIIFTKANSDTFGRIINKMIDGYVEKNKQKAVSLVSLGQLRYLSTMQYVDAIVGNSSSGIIEAPSFKVGTINIGDRQKGRIRAESVIDCKAEKIDILKAFKILYSQQFQELIRKNINYYGDGNTAKKIIKIIKDNIDKINIKKRFHNIVI